MRIYEPSCMEALPRQITKPINPDHLVSRAETSFADLDPVWDHRNILSMRSLANWFLLGFLVAPELSAADWPQFRGPQAGGLDTNAPASVRWNVERGENIRWQTPIPGLGHSSPVIWDNRIYVTTAVRPGKAELKVGLYGDIASSDDSGPQEWRLLALDKATGKILWDKPGHTAVPRAFRHPKSSHCNSTPAVAGALIVAIFGSEGLFCFGRDGDLLWKKDLGPMNSGYYQVPSAQWGFASSPVIHDSKVVVLCDVQKDSFLAVFDLTSGKEIWRVPRKDVPTWSTPT